MQWVMFGGLGRHESGGLTLSCHPSNCTEFSQLSGYYVRIWARKTSRKVIQFLPEWPNFLTIKCWKKRPAFVLVLVRLCEIFRWFLASQIWKLQITCSWKYIKQGSSQNRAVKFRYNTETQLTISAVFVLQPFQFEWSFSQMAEIQIISQFQF